MSERLHIIDIIIDQGGESFPGSLIVDEARVRPSAVYAVIGLMDCVEEVGKMQGEARMVNKYQVTGKPPECCGSCAFHSVNANSCRRAPTYREPSDAGQLSVWDTHLQMCEEAKSGFLTDRHGNLILPVGHL
ncbi:MAG: hypothetical protein AAB557_05255 [Patescibacteria group bacterium]